MPKTVSEGVLSPVFKAYDIRGVVGETLAAGQVEAIGAAFADLLRDEPGTTGRARIAVGGDMRPSSPEFARAFARGATTRGADVIFLGEVSTDQLYYACGSLDTAGAMFTASHNPAQYNGIKLARPGARPVSEDNGLLQVRAAAEAYLEGGIVPVEDPGTTSEADTLADYARHLRSLVDLSGIRALKVVVDAGNGMAGLTVPAVLGAELPDALPLEILPLYFELDGTFPNHPANPLEPENLRDLQRAVVDHGADIGLAFDGDADRCFVVDERGGPVTPSAVTAMVGVNEVRRARAAGEERPVVLHNLISSRAVAEAVADAGGEPVRTRVGHSFIKAEMERTGAVFGGEHSAHYYFRDFWNADTGMLAALHVLRELGGQDRPLSELARERTPYPSSGEINSTVRDVPAAFARLDEAFLDTGRAAVDTLDGRTYTARDGSWWFNVRASNTEPFLRLNAEADDQPTLDRLVAEALAAIRGSGDRTPGDA